MRRLKNWVASLLAFAMVVGMMPAAFAVDNPQGTVTISQETVQDGIYKLVIKGQTSVGNITTAIFVLSFDNTVIQPVAAKSPYGEVTISDDSTDASAFASNCAFVDLDTPYFSRVGAKWAVRDNRSAFALTMKSSSEVEGTPITSETTIAEFYYSVKDGQEPTKGTFRIETIDEKNSLLSELFSATNEQRAIFLGTKSDSVPQLSYGAASGDNLNATLTYTGSNKQKLGSLELGTVDAVTVSAEDQTTKAPTVTAKDTTGDAMTAPALTWTYTPESAPTGVTYHNDGTITVSKDAESREVKVKASADGVESNEATISITRPAAALTKVSLTPDTVTVTGGSDGEQTVTATAYDQFGTEMTEGIAWSIANNLDDTNVTISGNTITVKAAAKAGAYTVKAEKDATSKTATLKIERAGITPTNLMISGGQTDIEVPGDGEEAKTSTAFTASVTDQFGDTYTSGTVTWEIKDSGGQSVNGVSIAEGVVSVTNDAKAAIEDTTGKTFTITATCGTATNTKTITVKRAASTGTTVKIYRGGTELKNTDTVVKPVSADDSKEYTYSAKLFDQYDKEMTSSVPTFEAVTGVTGVTFDESAGKLTVASEAAKDTKVTLKATDSSSQKSAQVEVTITDVSVEWTAVDNVFQGRTLTYGDKNSAVGTLPASGTATAGNDSLTGTFAYAAPDAVQAVGTGSVTVTVKFTADNKVAEYAGVEVTKDYTVTINKRPITVTVDNATRAYGESNPAFTYKITNGSLVGSDSQDALGITLSCTATENSPAGTPVDITGTASPANYDVTITKGSLTITKANITSVADPTAFTAILANASENATTEALLNAVKSGRDTLSANYGSGKTTTVTAEWALTSPTWDAKGGTYTYTATLKPTDTTNFNTPTDKKTLIVTVTPVTGTINWSVSALTKAKSDVTNASNITDLLGVTTVTVTYDHSVTDGLYNITGSTPTLETIQGYDVSKADKVVDVIPTVQFPAWATISNPQALKTTLTITNKYVLPSDEITFADSTITYGDTYTPNASVSDPTTYGTVTFTYTYTKDGVTVEQPVDAGTYIVTATGESDTHKGSKTAKLTIESKSITNATVAFKGSDGSFTDSYFTEYTGKEQTPEVKVTLGGVELKPNTDYTVGYSNNENVGSATVTITGKGNYKDTATGAFTITAVDISGKTPTVTLNGSATTGGVLTASLADVADSDVTWQWYHSGTPDATPISGATSKTYVIADTDSNKGIYVVATARAGGNCSGESQKSDVTQVDKATISGTVTIEEQTNVSGGTQGTIEVGDTLKATPNVTPAETNFTYQWTVNGTVVEGNNSDTYTVKDGDTSISVTANAAGDYQGSVTSATVEVGKTALGGVLTISGTGTVGSQLTATYTNDSGTAPEADDYTIVWMCNGVEISGATGTTYTIVAADKGKTITAKAVAKGDKYTGEVLCAAGIAVAATAPSAPSVTATAGDGKVTLKWSVSDNGGAFITGYIITYQSSAEAAATTISVNASVSSYEVTGLTNGTEYTFKVTATNSVGSTDSSEVKVTPKGAAVTPPSTDDDDTPGGSTGGGSAGGSSSSGSTTVGKPSTSGGETVVSTQVKPTVSGTTANVSISSTNMNKAVDSVLETAQKEGTAPVLEIAVDTPSRAEGLNVELPTAALATLSQNGDAVLTIDSGIGMLSLDAVGVEALAYQAGSRVSIRMMPVSRSSLTSSQSAAVGSNPVYDVSAASSGNAITSLRGGEMTVSLPYSLQVGQEAANVVVYAMNDSGNLTPCDTEYNTSTKMVTFTTTEFSKFVIGYDQRVTQVKFSDVNDSSWSAQYIYDLVERGIVDGVGGNRFDPTRAITRAEFIKMLAGVAGITKDNLPAGSTGFADVKPNSWYAGYVNWAVKSGVTNGLTEAAFGPDAIINREQMSTMIYRYVQDAGIKLPTSIPGVTFQDADSFSDWAVDAIEAMQRSGIINGVGGNRFDPAEGATREQVCKVLSVLLGIMEN